MNIISWNVNGIKSCLKKGLAQFINQQQADLYCFQEIKVSGKDTATISFPGYHTFWFPAEKPGYAGVAVCSRQRPLSVTQGIGDPVFDREGRVLTLEFPRFFLVNAYFPHAHRELTRLQFKLAFNNAFDRFCATLNAKPLVLIGDFNVAHKEIDLRNSKQNEGNAGFTAQERAWFDCFLNKDYVDTFRLFVSEGAHYTWWTYRNNARLRNIGWRIDYALVSEALKTKVANASILSSVSGSDHCPIGVEVRV